MSGKPMCNEQVSIIANMVVMMRAIDRFDTSLQCLHLI